jgi:hypothetical protein
MELICGSCASDQAVQDSVGQSCTALSNAQVLRIRFLVAATIAMAMKTTLIKSISTLTLGRQSSSFTLGPLSNRVFHGWRIRAQSFPSLLLSHPKNVRVSFHPSIDSSWYTIHRLGYTLDKHAHRMTGFFAIRQHRHRWGRISWTVGRWLAFFFFFRIGLDRYGLSTRTRHVSAGRKRKAFGNGSCRTEGQKSKLDSLTADHTIRLDLTDPGIQTKTRHHVSAERGEKARGDTSFRTEERERARQLDSRWND